MITTFARPLTAEERAALEQRLASERGRSRWSLIYPFCCTSGCLAPAWLALALALRSRGPTMLGSALVAVAALVGVVTGTLALREDRRIAALSSAPFRRDVADGHATVLHFTASGVVRVDDAEEETTGYFFQVEDGRLLYLQGEYLREARGVGFPSTEGMVITARHSHTPLGVETMGEPLAPLRVRGALVPGVEYMPEDRQVLDGRLETLQEDLARLEERRKAEHGQ